MRQGCGEVVQEVGAVQEIMCNEEDMHAVLRLMCLLSLTQSGIAKKYFDALRKEFLQSYGHEYLLMLSKLQDAGGWLHSAAQCMIACRQDIRYVCPLGHAAFAPGRDELLCFSKESLKHCASQCCTCEGSVAVWKSVSAGQEGATGIWGGRG